MKQIVIISFLCCSFLQMNGQNNPQYAFYGNYDLSFLNKNAKNDVDESESTELVLLLAKFFELEDKSIVDLHYRLYEIEHTSVISYTTINDAPLNFQCVDSLDVGQVVDFGSSLICNKRNENRFRLGFASPVTKIDPNLFTESVISIKLPSTNNLVYYSSPSICVKNLKEIIGKDVVNQRILVSKDGKLFVAAVSDLKTYIVPDVVKEIGDGAFRGCQLEELVIPETVSCIGSNVFDNCFQLKSLVLKSNDVVSIAESCFGNQTLSELTIRVPKKTLKHYKKKYPSLKNQFKAI